MSDPAGAQDKAQDGTQALTRLLLLRHGEVQSHRGDVPVTPAGLTTAHRVGEAVAARHRSLHVLTGGTLRTRATAQAVADGARAAGAAVDGPREAFALRNPDLYLGGHRVDMVSSAATFAAQVPGLTEQQAAAADFVSGFLTAPDRIGWWLRHPSPPGDDAAAVRRRIDHFAVSLLDLIPTLPSVTVAVTHSPVIRACALADRDDPGEPPWVGGAEIEIFADRTTRTRWIGSLLPVEASP